MIGVGRIATMKSKEKEAVNDAVQRKGGCKYILIVCMPP